MSYKFKAELTRKLMDMAAYLHRFICSSASAKSITNPANLISQGIFLGTFKLLFERWA